MSESTVCGAKRGRKRGRKSFAPKTSHPLVARAIGLIAGSGKPDHVVVVAAGLSRNTISNWRRRSMPSVSHLDAVLNALGYRLAILPCDNSGVVGGADGKPTAEHAQRVKSDETNKERENATNEQYG